MERQYLTPYSWHQSHDQATVLLHVPYETIEEDVEVVIERNNLVAGVRGQPPVIKGRLYGNVDVLRSMWQLETHHASQHLARERTISTVSTASTQSSYAYVSSDVDISSSFAASLDSAAASDSEDASSPPSRAFSSPRFSSGEDLSNLRALRQPASPPLRPSSSLPSSFSSLESLPPAATGRLLTLHLEKADPGGFWPALVVGPVPLVLSPSLEADDRYNMDATSLALLAIELHDIRKDKEGAFEMFIRAWRQSRVPSAGVRLISYFTALKIPLEEDDPSTLDAPPAPGTPAYHLARIGGAPGLAHLYLEVGLLHLEGAAPPVSPSTAGLSSLRLPSPSPSAERESWRRDRARAHAYFDRARRLCPDLDVPALEASEDDQLVLPSIALPTLAPKTRARRRADDEKAASRVSLVDADADYMDNTWYLYVPGLVGAGLAVAVVGILSFSWSKRDR